MKLETLGAEFRGEIFSTGLEVSASHVRLGDQSWAVNQIKQVGISTAASGIGMIVCGLLLLIFVPMLFFTLSDGGPGGEFLSLVLCIWSGYGVYSSWNGVKNAQVWLKTGVVPTFIFTSRDKAEAQRVKELLERAIALHTPSS